MAWVCLSVGGADALRNGLKTQGVAKLQSINESLKAATPWSEKTIRRLNKPAAHSDPSHPHSFA